MLYIIGLGLGDEKDITVKGIEAIKKCDKVYIEAYTSLLSFGISDNGISTLEKFYGKPITLADREFVEEKSDDMLLEAGSSDVAFLVVGDPFGATTHSDLVVRANKLGVDVKVVHNASVMNAVGVCGLQLYRYGETVSIPFFTETWKPDSFYDKIQKNRKLGLHTLCLLDIRVKEPTLESLCRGKKLYEPPRYMSIGTAIQQLLEVVQSQGENDAAYGEDTTCVGLARLGSEDQKVVSGPMKQLLTVDFGAPLHCLVIVGNTHPLEEEMLEFYTLNSSTTSRHEANETPIIWKGKKRTRNDDSLMVIKEAATIIGNEISKATLELTKAIGVEAATADKRQKINSELMKIELLEPLGRIKVLSHIARYHELTDVFFTLNEKDREVMAMGILDGTFYFEISRKIILVICKHIFIPDILLQLGGY